MDVVSAADLIMESPMWTRIGDIAWRYLRTKHLGAGWDHAKHIAIAALGLMTHDQLHNADLVNTVVVAAWLFDVIPQLGTVARDDLWTELQPIVGQWYVINELDDLERILKWSLFENERDVPDWRTQPHKLTTAQMQIRDLVSDAERLNRTGTYGWDRIVVKCTISIIGNDRPATELLQSIVQECERIIDLPQYMSTDEGKRRIIIPHREFTNLYRLTVAKITA